MSETVLPLSPTVAAIFAEFCKKLDSEKVLNIAAIDALRQALDAQKLDPDSLREAIFAPTDTTQ